MSDDYTDPFELVGDGPVDVTEAAVSIARKAREYHAKVDNDLEPDREACACGLDMPVHAVHVREMVGRAVRAISTPPDRRASQRDRLPLHAPPEPTGLGAVVEDREGDRWSRIRSRPEGHCCWLRDESAVVPVQYRAIDAIKVLSEGAQTTPTTSPTERPGGLA